ncbi:MAG: hypothetical protein PHN18_06945 [Sulfurospirillaceae bacterium]|nr:hypothetical protein [Sulfurospirillaceae bacterium]MDD2827556.1 hypothetical protein [Sulfurospirillaceae bacterium]
MRLLLINNNPAVSRLIKLSVEKAGHEIDEFEDYGLVPLKSYDVIMVDNELFDENELEAVKEQTHCSYCIYVCQRGAVKPDSANVILEKPFLPTDFLVLLDKVKNVIESYRAQSADVILLDDNDEEEELVKAEKETAFDIDSIGGLEDEDEIAQPLENHNENIDNSEDDETLHFSDTSLDDDEEMELPTFDLETQEEDLELSLADTHTIEEGAFVSQTTDDVFEEKEDVGNAPSVLDRDDINEVKQLLDDDESDSKEVDFEDVTFENDALDDNEEELDLLEKEEETPLSVETFEDDESMNLDSIFDEEDEALSKIKEDESFEENALAFHEVPIEIQEDMIDDFEEKIEEECEESTLCEEKTEIHEPSLISEINLTEDVLTLDELNENLIKKAFGEEVEEEKIPEKEEALQEIEVIRGEIESSISKSIAGFAQSDILREALKGMKINISITFDDKN